MDMLDRSLTKENHVWRGLQHGNAAVRLLTSSLFGMQEAISAMISEYKKHYRVTKSLERNLDVVSLTECRWSAVCTGAHSSSLIRHRCSGLWC